VCVSKRFPDRLVNFDGFDVGLVVHGLPQAGKFKIDDSSGAILVAQWTVFRDRVPGVKEKLARYCFFLREAQYFFIRSDTSLRAGSSIDLRPRRPFPTVFSALAAVESFSRDAITPSSFFRSYCSLRMTSSRSIQMLRIRRQRAMLDSTMIRQDSHSNCHKEYPGLPGKGWNRP